MNFYALLADAISALHLVYMAYVVFGQLAILIGWPLRWRWIRNPWFRITHLTMILIVVGEAICSYECPLTSWELKLRVVAGQLDPNFRDMGDDWEIEDMSFTARLVRNVLFCDEKWQDAIAYSYYVFAGLVLTTAVLAPPRFRKATIPSERWRRLRRGVTAASLATCIAAIVAMIYLFGEISARNDYFAGQSPIGYELWNAVPYLLMGWGAYLWRNHLPASLITFVSATLISAIGLFIQFEAMWSHTAPPASAGPRPEIFIPLVQIIMFAVVQGIVTAIAWLEGSLPAIALERFKVALPGETVAGVGTPTPVQADQTGIRRGRSTDPGHDHLHSNREPL